MELKGKVTSGIGTAKIWVSKIEEIFKKRTGMKVFHGTLNIKLDEEYIIEPDWIIKPEEFGGTENVLVKKCEILGTQAYIVRAEKNQIGEGEHDLKIIEIIADINFRKKYGLKDGDRIITKILQTY